ncbi:MAG: AsmA-like C-terminal domain-containing protein [Zetaproteobacteria bacterium]|nr:AsmA-like C-terminal domain-containing protein [Zetaproteobacteria bacterium]
MTYFKNALTTCWRVFLLLMLFFTASLLLLYQFFPDIKRLQPELEMIVQQELNLSSVNLGELSWTWGWNVGIIAKHSSFSRDDLGLSLKNSRFEVRLSLADLLKGNLGLKSIHIKGGDANVQLVQGKDSSALAWTPIRVELDDVHVHWAWKKESSGLHIQSLKLLPSLHEVRLNTPSFQALLHYDEALQADSVHVNFQSLEALPKAWRHWMHGKLSGNFDVHRQTDHQQKVWQGSWLLEGGDASLIQWKSASLYIPVDAIEGKFSCRLSSKGLPIQWDMQDVRWSKTKNNASANVSWEEGILTLKAQSSHLDMPLLWSWLKPLDDDMVWHQWLDDMQAGVGKGVNVRLTFPWRNFPDIPEASVWKDLHYRVQADVYAADISLGKKGSLRDTQGHVDLNERGLQAMIHQARLPQGIGQVQGTLWIPWHNIAIHVKGHGDVDVAKLQAWASPQASRKTSSTFAWISDAPAQTEFSLQWLPSSGDFTELSTHFKPKKAWHVRLYDHPFWLDSGDLTWDMKLGLTGEKLHGHDDDLNASVSFSLRQNESDASLWSLKKLNGDIDGVLNRWVKRYQLPIESAQGKWQASVGFDGHQWMGDLNLDAASWQNLLGSHKQQNQTWKLHYQGVMSEKTFQLTHISSHQAPLQFDAYGEVSSQRIVLNISNLKTDAVDGNVRLYLPLDKGIWQVNMKGAYLNRQALPKHVPRGEGLEQRSWHIWADIDQFEWNKTRMQAVHLDMSSNQSVASQVKASRITSKALSLEDVEAHFNVLKGGKIDIHHLTALMQRDKILISALLTPETLGGMKWQGYAILDGSLGALMQHAKLSTLLEGGKMHAVLLGEGFLFRDKPWWQGLRGRLRIHSRDGEILKGGTLTKFLAVLSWADLPRLLLARRPDLTRKGLVYEHLQVESTLHNRDMKIQRLALDSSAVQLAGQGTFDLDVGNVDVMLVAQPFQNLDAVLTKLPILGYVLGGSGHSIFRRAYHVYGPVADAQVDGVSPKDAGAPSSGLIDRFLNLPDAWFGNRKSVAP